MLEIIIGLLMSLGVSLHSGNPIIVHDIGTGSTYGLGSTAGSGQAITFYLYQDCYGRYRLIRR